MSSAIDTVFVTVYAIIKVVASGEYAIQNNNLLALSVGVCDAQVGLFLRRIDLITVQHKLSVCIYCWIECDAAAL